MTSAQAPRRPPRTPPFHLLAKPAGATCNIDCKYCFFLSKETLYAGARPRMSDEVLALYIRQRLECCDQPEINIAWQGGEPTLMGLDFFRRSVELAEKHRRPGQKILHTIQTNGLLIDEAWCAFFKEHDFLVGLSVDGPQPLHDAYRTDKNGNGTHPLVMRAAQRMRHHGVEVNYLCAVHAANGDHPLEVYRFLCDALQARYLQFIPIVERATPQTLALANAGWGERPGARRPLYLQQGSLVTQRSVGALQYGKFLSAIFDEWVARDVGKVFVQSFDVALASWLGHHSLCIFAPECGNALALEHNGDVYSCDHYVEPQHLLGNIQHTHLQALVTSEQQRQFGRCKSQTLPQYCRDCDYLFACHGECPRNRFMPAPDQTPGLNYLCAGYRQFFAHIDAAMHTMANLLRTGRYADEIMTIRKGV